MRLAPPEPLAVHHDLAAFSCGEPSLDDWLKRRALANHIAGATRTFVVADQGRVIAYHALASGSIAAAEVSGAFRRNMPDPIPVAIWARVAIDRAWQGKGIGRGLLKDAALRIHRAAQDVGIRGLVVHAISAEAAAFYAKLGFRPTPHEPMTLVASLREIDAIVG
ncbi:MAG: GNAT family N-acetyltransferase [Alphaproteobacteria bacterium]|nr:GNAT family N-acetyltransferase [Alphaproteobacteria bacterium]